MVRVGKEGRIEDNGVGGAEKTGEVHKVEQGCLGCRWRSERASARAGKESKHGAGQTAGRGRPGADPNPSRCMAADVGGSSRQTASGLNDQRHQARLPSGLPSRPDRAEASKAEPLLGQRAP